MKFIQFMVLIPDYYEGSVPHADIHVYNPCNKFNILQVNAKAFHNSHVGKYDRADDRPKLAMLAANVGYQYWTC